MAPEIDRVSSASPAPSGSSYDRVARFYDLTYAEFDEDLPMYQAFARRCGSPILEVGCGTGRVVVPLAEAGFAVTGIDVSEAMLGIARDKVARAGVADRATLRQTDALHIDLGEEFAMAIVASNSFGLFVGREEQLQLLDSVRGHLRPRGLLIVDVFNPDLALLSAEAGQMYHDFTRVDPATGHTVVKLHSRQVDLGQQIIDVTFIYDDMDAGGTVRRTLFPFPSRFFFVSELELLLERAGFRLEGIFGSYELEPYHSESDRIILVATPARPRPAPGGRKSKRSADARG